MLCIHDAPALVAAALVAARLDYRLVARIGTPSSSGHAHAQGTRLPGRYAFDETYQALRRVVPCVGTWRESLHYKPLDPAFDTSRLLEAVASAILRPLHMHNFQRFFHIVRWRLLRVVRAVAKVASGSNERSKA